jgi:prophage DNA circulation protein
VQLLWATSDAYEAGAAATTATAAATDSDHAAHGQQQLLLQTNVTSCTQQQQQQVQIESTLDLQQLLEVCFKHMTAKERR